VPIGMIYRRKYIMILPDEKIVYLRINVKIKIPSSSNIIENILCYYLIYYYSYNVQRLLRHGAVYRIAKIIKQKYTIFYDTQNRRIFQIINFTIAAKVFTYMSKVWVNNGNANVKNADEMYIYIYELVSTRGRIYLQRRMKHFHASVLNIFDSPYKIANFCD